MKDYFNIDLYIDNKLIIAREPFTSTKELISACESMSKIVSEKRRGRHCEVVLYRNGGFKYSYDFYNQYNYHRNVCELIVAVYYHCDFDIYCEE